MLNIIDLKRVYEEQIDARRGAPKNAPASISSSRYEHYYNMNTATKSVEQLSQD